MSEYLYLISKAKRERDPEYRASVMNRIPGARESDLDAYYRRGTAFRRTGRELGYTGGGALGGGVAGGAVGGAIGAGIGKLTRTGGKIGGLIGADLGGTGGIVGGALVGNHKSGNKSIQRGDVKYVRRGDKKKVTGFNAWSGPRFER